MNQIRLQKLAAHLLTLGVDTIAVDVDGVVTDSRKVLAEFASLQGVSCTLNPTAKRGWDFLGIAKDRYEGLLHHPEHIAMEKPLIEGVKGGLALLQRLGFNVDLLTAIDACMVEARRQHMKAGGLPFGQLLIVPRGSDSSNKKGEVLRALGSGAILIDDYDDNVTAANAVPGCVGVLFTQPYNVGNNSAVRLDGWRDAAIEQMLADVLNRLVGLHNNAAVLVRAYDLVMKDGTVTSRLVVSVDPVLPYIVRSAVLVPLDTGRWSVEREVSGLPLANALSCIGLRTGLPADVRELVIDEAYLTLEGNPCVLVETSAGTLVIEFNGSGDAAGQLACQPVLSPRAA